MKITKNIRLYVIEEKSTKHSIPFSELEVKCTGKVAKKSKVFWNFLLLHFK